MKRYGHCSIVQFCPDAMRCEVVNVGVVLLCESLGYLATRTTDDLSRLSRFFPDIDVLDQRLLVEIRFVERRLSVDREKYLSVDRLRRFIETRANRMRLTPLRPVTVEGDPADALERLFQAVVA